MDTELPDTEIFLLKQSLDLPSLEIPSLFLQSPNLLTTDEISSRLPVIVNPSWFCNVKRDNNSLLASVVLGLMILMPQTSLKLFKAKVCENVFFLARRNFSPAKRFGLEFFLLNSNPSLCLQNVALKNFYFCNGLNQPERAFQLQHLMDLFKTQNWSR